MSARSEPPLRRTAPTQAGCRRSAARCRYATPSSRRSSPTVSHTAGEIAVPRKHVAVQLALSPAPCLSTRHDCPNLKPPLVAVRNADVLGEVLPHANVLRIVTQAVPGVAGLGSGGMAVGCNNLEPVFIITGHCPNRAASLHPLTKRSTASARHPRRNIAESGKTVEHPSARARGAARRERVWPTAGGASALVDVVTSGDLLAGRPAPSKTHGCVTPAPSAAEEAADQLRAVDVGDVRDVLGLPARARRQRRVAR